MSGETPTPTVSNTCSILLHTVTGATGVGQRKPAAISEVPLAGTVGEDKGAGRPGQYAERGGNDEIAGSVFG